MDIFARNAVARERRKCQPTNSHNYRVAQSGFSMVYWILQTHLGLCIDLRFAVYINDL